jgi:PAS domain S-box-containing protein
MSVSRQDKPDQHKTGKPSREEILRQYEFLLDISDTYLSLIDRDYTYMITNEAFCRAHNLDKEDVIGNTPMRIWGKETFHKIIKPYLDESFCSKEIRYTRWFEVPGKGKRFFEVIFRPHLNDQGEVDFVLVSSSDQTEQENTRLQLERQKEDMELVNIVNRMYSEGKDVSEITTVIVQRITKLFHAFSTNIFLTDDLSSGLRPLNFFLPENLREEIGHDINKNIFSKGFGQRSYFKYVLRRKKVVRINSPQRIRRIINELADDQEARDLLLDLIKKHSVSSMLVIPLLKDDESIGVLGIARKEPFDEEEVNRIMKLGYQFIVVLKRKREEQRMREQSEKIRLLFETSDDAIFLLRNNEILDCNPAAVRMFEAGSRSRLIGENPLRLFPVQQKDGDFSEEDAIRYYMRVMNGERVTLEFLHITLKGKEFFGQVKLNRLMIGKEYYIQAVVRDIDKEKRTRLMLEENERSLEEAQRIAHLGDWSWNLATNHVRWSDEFFRIFGYHPGKHKPSIRLFARRIHPDDRKRVLKKISGAISDCRKKCVDQFRLQMPDGSVKFISSSGVLEYMNGQPNKWHGTIHDITSLKEVEKILLYQSHELSLINRLNLELNKGTSLGKITHIFDKLIKELYPFSHILVYLRDPFEEEFHLAYSTLGDKQRKYLSKYVELEPFYHFPADRFQQLIRRSGKSEPMLLISGEQKLEEGIRFLLPDKDLEGKAVLLFRKGKLRSLIIYPIMEGDKMLGFISLNSEEVVEEGVLPNLSGILDQVVMVFLKKISENEMQRLYNAIEQLGEVLVVSDRRGRILYINRAVQEMLGYRREELLGQYLNVLRHPEEDPVFYENIWKNVLQGKHWVGVHRLKRRDGVTVKTRTNITPIMDEHDQILYFVTIMRDVTKELALEHYLQRTHKLEMMGRFAGGLAHDFNNMLATVMGYVEMVMDETDKRSRTYRYLDKARISGKKAGEVIRQLLTFNRGVEPEKEKVDMTGVLKETIMLIKPQISRHVKVEVEDLTGGVQILADRAQIRQVFLNLITNAAYAVREKENGSIRVVLDVVETGSADTRKYPELNEGRWLRVRTIDNGEGIPPDMVDKVFDPFFTTKPVGKGSGMGLSVVHGIVRNHNGVVHLESTPGEGTVFTVFLPAGTD